MAESICKSTAGRLYVTDRHSQNKFLIDTGSDLCVFPRSLMKGFRPPCTEYELSAANGSRIKTYGFLTLSLNFGLRRRFTWKFVVTNVSTPIIGIDFLAAHDLIVDVGNGRLIDRLTSLSIYGSTTRNPLSTCRVLRLFLISLNFMIFCTNSLKSQSHVVPTVRSNTVQCTA
jgi:predicted aspartyl protease